MRSIKGLTNQSPPWEPTPVEPFEIAAIQALSRGEASQSHQLNIVRWLERSTGVSELEFRAAGERESNFAAGKRFIGLQFFSLVKARMPEK